MSGYESEVAVFDWRSGWTSEGWVAGGAVEVKSWKEDEVLDKDTQRARSRGDAVVGQLFARRVPVPPGIQQSERAREEVSPRMCRRMHEDCVIRRKRGTLDESIVGRLGGNNDAAALAKLSDDGVALNCVVGHVRDAVSRRDGL